jgi:hypothetical protein
MGEGLGLDLHLYFLTVVLNVYLFMLYFSMMLDRKNFQQIFLRQSDSQTLLKRPTKKKSKVFKDLRYQNTYWLEP